MKYQKMYDLSCESEGRLNNMKYTKIELTNYPITKMSYRNKNEVRNELSI